jgi:hypothetical protein
MDQAPQPAERARRGRAQDGGFAGEHGDIVLRLRPRNPVHGILQRGRDAAVVFGGGDDQAVMLAKQRLETPGLLGQSARGLDVTVIESASESRAAR